MKSEPPAPNPTPSVSVRPIRSEDDYQEALARIDRVVNEPPGTPGYDELEVVSALVWCYEQAHDAPASPPTLREMVRFLLEDGGKRPEDLLAVFGSSEEAEAVLAGGRDITAAEARRLRDGWGIPFEVSLAAPTT